MINVRHWLKMQNNGLVIVCFAIVLFVTQVVTEHSVGATKKPVPQALSLQYPKDGETVDKSPVQEDRNPFGAAEALPNPEVNQELQRGRQVTLEATGYTCGPESTGKHPSSPDYCQTASGYRLKPGDKVVAMGEKYPFGTSVVVPGYGVAIVRDRGGAVTDNHIDLYFEQHQDALNWGRRMVTVTVRH